MASAITVVTLCEVRSLTIQNISLKNLIRLVIEGTRYGVGDEGFRLQNKINMKIPNNSTNKKSRLNKENGRRKFQFQLLRVTIGFNFSSQDSFQLHGECCLQIVK